MQVNSIVTVKELDVHTKVQDVIFHDYLGDHEVSRVRRSPKYVFICHDTVNDAVLLQYRTNLNSMVEGYFIPEISIDPNADDFEPVEAMNVLTMGSITLKSAVEVMRLNADSREFAPVAFMYCIFDSRQIPQESAEWATTPASLLITKYMKGKCEGFEEYIAGSILKSMRYQ